MNKIITFIGHSPQGSHKLRIVLPLILILLTISCQIDGEKKVDRSKFNFKTGDDTELFFKNIRQSEYELEVNEAAKLHVFRHNNRPLTDSIPWLNPAIVINYLQDEAYLLLEPSPLLENQKDWAVHTGLDTFQLSTPNRAENLEFASRIYEHLKVGDSLWIRTDDGFVQFLSNKKDSEAFRITLSDYYRLTRIF